MNRYTRAIVVLSAILLAAAPAAQTKVTISIATGPTTGVYYPLGGGIANVLSKYVPGYAANAEATAGSVANLLLMQPEEVGHRAVDGRRGAGTASRARASSTSGAVPVRALMVAYPNRMHVVTVEGTGINKFADLKGKRVSTGAANSATELMAAPRARGAGLDPEKDIKRERLDPGKSSDAIKDRKLDAYFWVGGIPDRRRHRPRRHARHEAEAGRPRRSGRCDEQEVRPALRPGHDSRQVLSGPGGAEPGRHGVEPDRRPRGDARPDGLQHRQDDLREARRADPGAQGSAELRPRSTRATRRRRFRTIRAR